MNRSISPPVARWAALTVTVATIVLIAAALVLEVAVGTYYFPELALPGELGTSAAILTFSFVGLAIVNRHPAHPIAWLVLLLGLSSGLKRSLFGYAAYNIVGRPGAGADAAVALLVAEAMNPITLVVFTWLLLLFPDGRPMSRRWGLAGATATLAGLVLFVGSLAYPRPLSRLEWLHVDATTLPVMNPIGIDIPREQLDIAFGLVFVVSFLCFISGAASLLVRLHRSAGYQRQQLKWFAYACFFLVLNLGVVIFGPEGITRSVAIAMQTLSPGPAALAIGIAILRYRLYDIDLLIKRTLVYGATSGAIALTFFAGIVALQTLLRPLTAGSELAVAASTLASFAIFQPLRRRVQAAVDRRFDCSRYDAARTVEAFADRLRDQVDLAALRSDLLAAVRETMAPVHASLWLRERVASEVASARRSAK